MKGMLMNVYRSVSYGDCTNGGVTSKADTVLLVGEGVPHVFEESDRHPKLVLKYHCGGWIAQPNLPAPGVGWMMGGNFIHTSDSRMSELGIRYPIPVHDRTESQAQYDMLSR
jgi:hypothetical protein